MAQFNSNLDNISGDSIPEKLVEKDRWVCWRYEQSGEKKPPYNPETGVKASIHESEHWADFETAIDQYDKRDYDGIGFVLTPEGPFTGFDFDNCRDPATGEIQNEVDDIIERLNSFSEVSPSRTGIHTIILGEKPDGYRNIEGIEVYDSERYFTVTGEHLEETPETIEPRSEELRAICEEHLTENSSNRQEEFSKLPEHSEKTEDIEEAREYIRSFLYAPETGPRPPDYFTDLLKGRYTDRGFEGDRSAAETTLCSLTYGIFLDGGAEAERARELTYHYITHAVIKNPYTASEGEVRKWIEEPIDGQQNYRKQTLDYAIQNFDPKIWDRWRQSGHRTDTDDYCEHAYEVALDALYNLTVECALIEPPHLSTNNTPADCGSSRSPRSYPTMAEITEQARREYELTGDSYREILRRLRREGGVKMARLDSTTYVYYPASYPDPVNACYVRVGGEKHEIKQTRSEATIDAEQGSNPS